MLHLYISFRYVSPLACLKCVPLFSEVNTSCLCVDWFTKVCPVAKLYFLPCIWINSGRIAFQFTMPLYNFVVKDCYRICLLFLFYADPSPKGVIKPCFFRAWNSDIHNAYVSSDWPTLIKYCLYLLMTKEQEKNIWYSKLLAKTGVIYDTHTQIPVHLFSCRNLRSPGKKDTGV